MKSKRLQRAKGRSRFAVLKARQIDSRRRFISNQFLEIPIRKIRIKIRRFSNPKAAYYNFSFLILQGISKNHEAVGIRCFALEQKCSF